MMTTDPVVASRPAVSAGRMTLSCLAVLVTFRIAVPNAAADSTTAFIANLREGIECYDAYQANTASGQNDWDAYKTRLAPVFETLRENFTISSWNAQPARSLSEFRSLTKPFGGDGGKFVDYLKKDKPSIGQDYFVQFAPRTAVECAMNFRLSLSIDENLSGDERFQQLATAMQALASDSTLKAALNWFKIETPAMVRADPLLLRFCYSTPESRNLLIARVNTVLGTTFKSSSSQYPPLQQRSGAMSLADYSRGYSFGSAACTYYKHFLTLAAKTKRTRKAAIEEGITKFTEHWTSKFGAFESTFVGDLCDPAVLPAGIDTERLGCE